MPTQCDPTTRLETWLFQEIGRAGNAKGGRKVFQQLPYVLVSYDGDPQQFVEPLPVDDFVTCAGAQDASATGRMFGRIVPAVDGLGRMSDILYVTKRPFETFAYNDVDAANNIGQLSNLDSMGRIISATA